MANLIGKWATSLNRPSVRRWLALERLTEPLHLNVAAAFVAVFGSTRAKINFDVLPLQQYAFGILEAADYAKTCGQSEIWILEFGVANGRGLMNMAHHAAVIGKMTGVKIHVAGFDTGKGMPPPVDYRDHPNLYAGGDFKMNEPALRAALPPDVVLELGDVADTIPHFMQHVRGNAPIGWISIDLDYYSSTVDALQICVDKPEAYLPLVLIYFDDIIEFEHNEWCGELLAINEFNAAHQLRKINPLRNLRGRRTFKNAWWIEKYYGLHVLDHPFRSSEGGGPRRIMVNPLLPPPEG
jgi:hypothetical protein